MKRTIILALLFTAISFAQSESGSGLTVEEVFSVETSEELEASLTDGYPMPWLAEILEDETIPEEDRYWLDCRVRAVIAQDLHLFYNREGNPVHIEADWIRYGENFWQEHFIMNPPGEYSSGEIDPFAGIWGEANPITGLWGETGFIYNQFGERTGELALCEEWMQLSRDGSTGLLIHRGSEEVTEYGPAFLYFVYSDGTFHMNPDELWIYDYTLSQSGEFALLIQREENESDPIQMFDRNGNLLWGKRAIGMLVTNTEAMVLPGDNVCAIPSATQNPPTHYTQIFCVNSGDELRQITDSNSIYHATTDGKTICIGNNCYSLTTDHVLWEMKNYSNSATDIRNLSTSNNLEYFSANFLVTRNSQSEVENLVLLTNNGERILVENAYSGQKLTLSPNGSIALTSNESRFQLPTLTPL